MFSYLLLLFKLKGFKKLYFVLRKINKKCPPRRYVYSNCFHESNAPLTCAYVNAYLVADFMTADANDICVF